MKEGKDVSHCLICQDQYDPELFPDLKECCSKFCFLQKQETEARVRIEIFKILEESKDL